MNEAVVTLQGWLRRTEVIAEKSELLQNEVVDKALSLLEWATDPKANCNPEITALLKRNQLSEPAFKAFLLQLVRNV